MWGRLGCATKKKQSPPASQCAVTDENNGERTVYTGQEPFKNATKSAVYRQYHGANNAPINSGQPQQDFGTIADTACAEALLQGDYDFPEDIEEATECIMREFAPLLVNQSCPTPMNIKLDNSDFHWWRTAPERRQNCQNPP